MDNVTDKIKALALSLPKIQKVILFGSRARRDNSIKSDYDIAVFCNDDETETVFRDRIDNLDTIYKIDLIFIKDRLLNTKLYENIKSEGIIVMDKFQNKLENFEKAYNRLLESIEESKNTGSSVIRDGVIQRFEFTTELMWKSIREYLISEGMTELNSPKSVMREAFANNLTDNDTVWIKILEDRNKTSHIYDEDESEEIYGRIANEYLGAFGKILEKLKDVNSR